MLMNMEQEPQVYPELNEEQLEAAEFFIDACGLRDVADAELNMMGQSGTVRYGLGRCAEYLLDLEPEQIRQMVMTKLAQQEQEKQKITNAGPAIA